MSIKGNLLDTYLYNIVMFFSYNSIIKSPKVTVLVSDSSYKIYTEHCSVWFYQLIDYYGQEEDDARKRMTEKGFLRWPDGAIRKILFIYLFIFYLFYSIFN